MHNNKNDTQNDQCNAVTGPMTDCKQTTPCRRRNEQDGNVSLICLE